MRGSSPRRDPARIELLCVGSELLSGQVNTHQSPIALGLKGIGLSLARETCLPDDKELLSREIRAALRRSDALLVCGGLGPTFDDVTREAAARALGLPLRYRRDLYAAIRRKFRRVGLPIPEENRRQAFVIAGARVLANKIGSAPGQLIVRRSPRRQTIALLPGPLSELKPIFEGLLPFLRRAYARGQARGLCVHLSGIPESAADERLKPLTERPGPGESFTILSGAGQVDFHASVTASTKAQARSSLKALRRRIYEAVGGSVFGEGPQTLPSALGRLLRRRGLSLAVAESCTGGMLGERLTSVPGSSDYFAGGVIAYSNALKKKPLGVGSRTLARRGAVSRECALEMADGIRRLAGTSLGLSITGIAGPAGGTKAKPVGLVYVGLARRQGAARAWELGLSGTRELIRRKAAAQALHLLLTHLRN